LYYTASGIITPVRGRPVHGLRADLSEAEIMYLLSRTLQEVNWQNSRIIQNTT